ncbi:phosphatase PAP2 family protein [Peribacillus alkalitolerans]|uniref:phosphatase PAP2 family protein n=1 Tax=Peribacillus alkalitolerans TaxID=1550385 RepID=UPI0013D42F6A|nr:phosphatase PAP2 family protein [Peribacillus alkalitolerans]
MNQHVEQKTTFTYVYSILLILSAALFFYLFTGVRSGVDFGWEASVQSYFQAWNVGVGKEFFHSMTEFGSKIVIGSGTLVLLAFLWFKKQNYVAMAMVVLAVAGGDQLNKAIKKLVERERPLIDASIDALGYSFPSGHAMVGFVFYVVVAYFTTMYIKSKNWKAAIWIWASLMILIVGLSRVVLSAHYPSDVLAGYAIGCLYVLSVLKVYKELYKFMSKEKQI